ncbi:MAG TPA: ATP-binding cassette domain-containing protein [Trebonia sp.]
MTYRAARSPLTWLGGLLAVYLAVPVIAFAIRFAEPGDRGFGTPGLWSALQISAESATITTALVAIFGIPLAYWLAHSRGPVATVTGVLVQLPLAIPPVMSGIVLIYLVGPYTPIGNFFGGNLTDTVTGVVLAQTFVASPFLIIAARSAFAAVDPALDDLAATLGHRPLARFWLVSLRVAGPGIRAGALLTWLRAIGEYGATVLLAYHPYTLPVFTYVQFSSTGIPGTQAPTALALGLALVVLLASLFRRHLRIQRPAMVPDPRPPEPAPPTTVGFDLDVSVGGFRLRLAHEAASHRVALLGPSGAGKSVTLRALAGLLGPGAGQVRYNGEPVSALPAQARRIGYVPQGLGLFPDRPVWRQMLFAVGADPRLAAWWLRTLRLDGLADRMPGQLSGGQRQRVSLARALTHQPRLVLLDEPFSALDAPVRDELRRELRRLQFDTGLSTVLVTHDPEEAALLADEILVIDGGRLLQAGPRAEVYGRPASPEVARLLGIPNLREGTVGRPGVLAAGEARISADTAGLPTGTAVLWCVRPERIAITADGGYEAEITDVADLGTSAAVDVRLPGGPELRARTADATGPGGAPLQPGDACRIDIAPAAITLWPAPAGASGHPAGEPVSRLPGGTADPGREQVPQADDAQHMSSLHHRQVAEPVAEHDLRGFVRGGGGRRRLRVLRHPRGGRCRCQVLAGGGRPDDVALGEDAGQERALHDEGRAHLLADHRGGGVRQGSVEGSRQHLLVHQVADRDDRARGLSHCRQPRRVPGRHAGRRARQVLRKAAATVCRSTRKGAASASRTAAGSSRRIRSAHARG